MEQRLRQLLENFRYESSIGWGQKKLMEHHINTLMKKLVPFFEQELNRDKNIKVEKNYLFRYD